MRRGAAAPRTEAGSRSHTGAPRGAGGPAHATADRGFGWVAVLAIVATIALAYGGALHGPFLFDDLASIAENPHVHHLWPLGDVLSGSARPLLALSFALNYAAGGLDVVGYHVVNVAIHLAAALLLFDVVKRTLALPRLVTRFPGRRATGIALAAAALWAAHPLATQAVSYLVQRGESLASFFYLATLDAAIRSETSARRRRWELAAVAACALGAATKPVVVSAPLVVLLYDRCFLFPSFRTAFDRRRLVYVGLAGCEVGLAALAAAAPDPSAGTAARISALTYALSQPGVVLHYLRLAIWPHPLVLDYAWPAARAPGAILSPLIVLLALGAAVVVAALRRSRVAFPGLAFFLILLPSSSVFPIDDLAVEHRMYLPLACLTVLAALGGHEVIVRRLRQPRLAGSLAALVVIVAITATIRRNRDYANDVAMWTSVVAHRPGNARAFTNLGGAWIRRGEPQSARPAFVAALRADSTYAEARIDLGSVMVDQGQLAEAIPQFRRALADDSTLDDAHLNLGMALAGLGRNDEAIAEYHTYLARHPREGKAWSALGAAQSASGHDDLALASYAEAVRVAPGMPAAHNNLGILRMRRGDVAGAIAEFQAAVRIAPDYEPARRNLERAVGLPAGRTPETAKP